MYEFEGFRLETHTQSLLSPVDGRQIALKPKEFDALLFFVEHAGELIDKDTLLQALWPDQDVEENNLSQYVTALRKILGEERGGRRFFMNVRARGYRFVPEVLHIHPAETTVASSNSQHLATNSLNVPTENLAAWQCYQQAVHLQNADHPDRWNEAVSIFEKAIELDPGFAAAYAMLSLTRIRLYMLDYAGAAAMLEQAREEARRAIELRPGAADGYMALGAINAAHGEWVRAELNYAAARELDSEWLMPYSMHPSHLWSSTGHLRKALRCGRESLIDVKGITRLVTLHAVNAAIADENQEAAETMALAQAMGAESSLSPLADVICLMALRRGAFDEAGQALLPGVNACLHDLGISKVISLVFPAMQDKSIVPDAVTSVNAFVARVDLGLVPQSTRRWILLWYAQLGALDEAFAFANRCLKYYQQYGIIGTAWGSLWLREMRPFRDDERFNDFVDSMKLPDYWKTFGPPDGYRWKDNRLQHL